MTKLGKKQLTLTLQQPLDEIPLELASLPLELTDNGNTLVYTFDTQADHTSIPDLLKLLGRHDIDFKDLYSSQSTLEEIFVNLLREDRA